MALIEAQLATKGLELPEPAKVPPGVVIDFAWARVHGDTVYVSGHAALAADGTLIGPFGRVGAEVSPEQAAKAAELATVAMLASIKREIGDLDRIEAWPRVDCFVLVAPGFERTTNVINGCSHLLIDLFGPERGRHARTAMGVAATPLSAPVVVAAQLALKRG